MDGEGLREPRSKNGVRQIFECGVMPCTEICIHKRHRCTVGFVGRLLISKVYPRCDIDFDGIWFIRCSSIRDP